MTTEIYISIIGALAAITVSVIAALFAIRNSIALQTRNLKEEHYIAYIEALHNNAEYNNTESIKRYVLARDKLFLVASEEVVRRIIKYEEEGIGKGADIHDDHLTALIKSIRSDLKLKYKDFPKIYFKTSSKR
ncbi:MAG TPA: hypothetical protein VK809_12765 [Bacteroidia bacterium]|jgi:hypothetical protein|nr:hypothetical protein [Bacteroidia bacterium]